MARQWASSMWSRGWTVAIPPISHRTTVRCGSGIKADRICLFTVSDDGHLVAQDPAEVTTAEGAGPRHMVFHPNEQYAYCVNELNSSVDVWELKDPHGNIECVQTLAMPENFSDTRWAADIHITPMSPFIRLRPYPPA